MSQKILIKLLIIKVITLINYQSLHLSIPTSIPVKELVLTSQKEQIIESVQPIIEKPSPDKQKKLLTKKLVNNKEQSVSLAEMAKWHTEAEQKVYKAMYQDAKTHNTKELYFTFLVLAEKTHFRNPRTIRSAILGLISKKSIEEISNQQGNHFGIRYKIFSPEEILQRRIEANINIDFQSKKIL